MRRLYKRLALTFALSAILFVLIFAVSLYSRGKAENGRYLDQLLTSVESNLEHGSDEYEEKLAHMKEEYISRARAVEYIAANDAQMIDRTGLLILKELMKTGEISLIDSSGNIFLSTDEELEGSRQEAAVLKQLAGGQEGALICMDEPDFRSSPGYFYALADSGSGRFAAVRVDADLARAGLISGKEMVGDIIRQATTEYGTSIFAVGKVRGRVFGITENNRQEIVVREAAEGEEMLRFLGRQPKGEPVILYINGAYQSAVIRDLGELYLVAFSGLDRVAGNVLLTFWAGFGVIGVISMLTVLTVRRHLKKYLFAHFEQVREGIYATIRGERSPEEDDSEIPELKPLMEMIVQLERGYVEKAQGMNQMEDQLSAARTRAEYDRLTGLHNRNGFEERAEAFLKEENPGGALILMDLDNFKRVNDCEGHPAGDRVLCLFAECLRAAFRREDVIGRLGGDEFVVLICNPVPARILEEKFAALLAQVHEKLRECYEKYRLSASIGAVPVDGSVRDYRKLYRCADTALYISKYMGKDRYYINEKMIDCMRRECIGCRTDCPRSRLLREGSGKGGDSGAGADQRGRQD